jgi:hypothetical protein
MHSNTITANEAFLSSVELETALTNDDGLVAQQHSAEISSVQFFGYVQYVVGKAKYGLLL